ncbi:MAG: hypothetical protein HND55_07495 [Pseudomonadota bacterium]|nr:MAG: hypothetical protein HND55_07495 [Pseudomonadota bacterium]
MNARYAARLLLVPLLVLTAWLAWWPDSHPPDTPDSQGKGESLLVWQIKPTAAGPQSGDFPRAGLPDGAVAALRPGERIDPDASMLTLPLPGRKPISLPVAGRFDHPNGDFTLHARGRASNLERAAITVGDSGIYARITTPAGIYQVTTNAHGTWLIDLADDRLDVDPLHDDTLGGPIRDAVTTHAAGADAQTAQAADAPTTDDTDPARIDVMFIYPDSMQARYPGNQLETRLNHLLAIANQALVDSQVPAAVRLVHHQRTSYSRSQNNREALQDLARALSGESIPGLSGLAGTRQSQGADLVVLTWPHDIETRGSCGIAFFPQTSGSGQLDPAYGVHIDNDGASNWSICSDAVFTHELGHNLGAEHQRGAASTDDPAASNYAFVEPARFHTVMGSFGSGHIDRYHRLDLYSNPDIRCGGAACGSRTFGEKAANAWQLAATAASVAAYADGDGASVERPPHSEGDSDDDGRLDRDDPYPFDPFDGEPPPDTEPPLVFDQRRLRTDTDTIAAWELLVVDSDTDQVLSYALDGQFRGVVAAPEAIDPGPILTGHSDLDIDGQGRLYLLASGDVRRYDRLSGQLIDVFLDSQLPEPRELQSSFPRAMGWLPNNQLVVLGDDAIERYSADRQQLNDRLGADEPTRNPQSWNSVMDLPLRSFAYRNQRLYVAEARSNRIMAFNELNGWRNVDVAGPDNGVISDPRDLAFGPDGLLYVANGSGNNVLRFDVDQRAFIDEFIPAGRGGLDYARALAFGPDERLYVASRDSGEILAFDAASGAFESVLTAAGDGGLRRPEALRLAPRLNQLHAGHSGHYFVPDRPGEGWLLEILDETQAALAWFTYPPAGSEQAHQAWILGIGDIDGSRIVFEDALTTRLIDAGAPIGEDNLVILPWGDLTLDFSHCDHGRVSYNSQLFGASGSLEFVRLANINGLPCGSLPLAPSSAAPGISGQWYDPDSSGQGWYFEEVSAGRVFTAWFTYAGDGEQAWVVGEGNVEGRTIRFEHLVTTRATGFGDEFDPDAIETLEWGSMSVQFLDCERAALEYDSVLPGVGSGSLAPRRLTWLSGLDCQLPSQ